MNCLSKKCLQLIQGGKVMTLVERKYEIRMKYIIGIVCSFLLLFAFVTPVFAAATMGSVTVSEGWNYDEETNTLTLSNYDSETVEVIDDNTIQIYHDGDLNLVLNGTNTLSENSCKCNR